MIRVTLNLEFLVFSLFLGGGNAAKSLRDFRQVTFPTDVVTHMEAFSWKCIRFVCKCFHSHGYSRADADCRCHNLVPLSFFLPPAD